MTCCGQAGGKCPGNETRYNSNGWVALNFSIPDPYNYFPGFTATGTGTAAVFTAVAMGDLDCDGTDGIFTRFGSVNPTSGDVVGGGAPIVTNELE